MEVAGAKRRTRQEAVHGMAPETNEVAEAEDPPAASERMGREQRFLTITTVLLLIVCCFCCYLLLLMVIMIAVIVVHVKDLREAGEGEEEGEGEEGEDEAGHRGRCRAQSQRLTAQLSNIQTTIRGTEKKS